MLSSTHFKHSLALSIFANYDYYRNDQRDSNYPQAFPDTFGIQVLTSNVTSLNIMLEKKLLDKFFETFD
jgi:hypothetical protein